MFVKTVKNNKYLYGYIKDKSMKTCFFSLEEFSRVKIIS